MQKIMYIAAIRLPTEKAHGLQIMKTCEALAQCRDRSRLSAELAGTVPTRWDDFEIELIIPRRRNPISADPFDFYKVKRNFTIKKLWCVDLIYRKIFGPLGYWLTCWTFFQAVKRQIQNQPDTIYYTRDNFIAYWLGKNGLQYYYEIHTIPDRLHKRHTEAWKRAKGLIVISNGLKAELTRHGVAEEKILVARDAVDVRQFERKGSPAECRIKLGLPLDQKIVLYTGHLYEWKGVHLLAEVASQISPKIHIYIVGGTPEDIVSFGKKFSSPNLHIVGWQPREEMPWWQKAADVLILPNSAKDTNSARYTSPLKLFEYMMSCNPIIAADVPALREVLSESDAIFFEPDNKASLIEAINLVLHSNRKLTQVNTLQYICKQEYSWDNRALSIKQFIFKS